MSWKGLGFPEAALMSERVSAEEGMVEDELRRAEEAALLYGALVETELSVQVLVLKPEISTGRHSMTVVHTVCRDPPWRLGTAVHCRP